MRIRSETVSNILNSVSPAKKLRDIAKEASASTTTVYNVLKDFPLWDYLRKKEDA